MKSVVLAAYLLTSAFGHLIVLMVAEFKPFESQATEFFMFTGLLFVDMIIFSVMAYFYKFVDIAAQERERENEELKKEQENNNNNNNGYAESVDL
jgi:phosphotransferase system  glucose/maltose/N-acetylglucosamine-specific IIC component